MEDFFVQLDTLPQLIEAVRPHLSKPADYFVSSTTAHEMVCLRRKGKKKNKILIQRATGKCMLDDKDLGINLVPESMESLREFHVPCRPKKRYTNASLAAVPVLHTLADGTTVGGILFPSTNECFFVENNLKERRVTYHLDKRVRVSKDHRIDVLHGLCRLKKIGNTSPSRCFRFAMQEQEEEEAEEIPEEEVELEDQLAGDEEPSDGIDLMTGSVEPEDTSSSSSYEPPTDKHDLPPPPPLTSAAKKRPRREPIVVKKQQRPPIVPPRKRVRYSNKTKPTTFKNDAFAAKWAVFKQIKKI